MCCARWGASGGVCAATRSGGGARCRSTRISARSRPPPTSARAASGASCRSRAGRCPRSKRAPAAEVAPSPDARLGSALRRVLLGPPLRSSAIAARADAQAGRAAGALRRCAVLGRLRPGSDARGARAGGQRRAELLAADRRRDRLPDVRRRRLLPADDPRLSARRRLLHRRHRQPRTRARAGRRRRPDNRLHPHGRRVGGVRTRSGHLGDPVAGPGQGRDRGGA